MPVPESIRKVERPVNTVVIDYGSDSQMRYAVRERKGAKCQKGKNPQPISGMVIGHIINNKFVPLKTNNSQDTKPFALSYGLATLAYSLSTDLRDDLLDIYSISDTYKIMAIAILQVAYPGISAYRLSSEYHMSFVSVYYPKVALSENTVSKFYKLLGENEDKRIKFYDKRMARVVRDDHVIIDGTLKQDNSTANSLSNFSYKSRLKNVKNISILYAFDLEKDEPICSQVFSGNFIDASSYRSFIVTNHITRGIIVDDKGFSPSVIKDEIAGNEDLHYLTPLRRNNRFSKKYESVKFQGSIKGIAEKVAYKKIKVSDDLYIYEFRDAWRAA